MLATILFHVPLVLAPLFQLPAPTADCQLEVLTPQAQEERTLAEFNRQVDHYVALHRRLERWLPPDPMFEDFDEMWDARDALAAAILDARPHARQGDFFSPGFAAFVGRRIDGILARSNYDITTVLEAINDEVIPGAPPLQVNGRFPWEFVGAAMWPALLQELPALPRELEYRFVDRDLVLIDVHADLVVDILADALPEATPRSTGRE
jgi:hypothetical protein